MSEINTKTYSKNEQKIYIYCRKSSEEPSKQVQSIGDQLRICRDLAIKNEQSVTHEYIEEKSAAKPYNRPFFDEMMEQVKSNPGCIIITYAFNRLSRNSVDSGLLQYFLEQKIIAKIITAEKAYNPEDNSVLMSVESGVANQYVRDLVKVAARGVESRVRKGWIATRPPLGYMNDIRNKTVVKDQRFYDMIRLLWDRMLAGVYSLHNVANYANNELHLKLIPRATQMANRKGVTPQLLHRIFHNTFYYGEFKWKGEIVKGAHEPMITKEEFNKVQQILSKRKNLKGNNISYDLTHKEEPYRCTIICKYCGAFMTPDWKKKMLIGGNFRWHKYYYCSRSKNTKTFKCPNTKGIKLEEIESEILNKIREISISDRLFNELKQTMVEIDRANLNHSNLLLENLHNLEKGLMTKIENYKEQQANSIISMEELKDKLSKNNKELSDIRYKIGAMYSSSNNWQKTASELLDFASTCEIGLKNGDVYLKNKIVNFLGSNFLYDGAKASFELNELLMPIKNLMDNEVDNVITFEPSKSLANTSENAEENGRYKQILVY